MSVGSWLDALLGRIQSRGVELDLMAGLNFAAPLIAVPNTNTKLTDVYVGDGSVAPSHAAPVAGGVAVPVLFYIPFVAGVAGTADDVTLIAAAPFAFRIVDVSIIVETAVGSSTARLRSATGGGGSALSGAIATGAAGTFRNAAGAAPSTAVAAAAAVYLRREDRGVAGEVVITAVRT